MVTDGPGDVITGPGEAGGERVLGGAGMGWGAQGGEGG